MTVTSLAFKADYETRGVLGVFHSIKDNFDVGSPNNKSVSKSKIRTNAACIEETDTFALGVCLSW